VQRRCNSDATVAQQWRVEAQPLPYLNDAAALEPPSFHLQRLVLRQP